MTRSISFTLSPRLHPRHSLIPHHVTRDPGYLCAHYPLPLRARQTLALNKVTPASYSGSDTGFRTMQTLS